MKIRHKLYVVLLIFTLLPLYVFGFFMIRENDNKVESILKEDLSAISGAQILDISDFCMARKQEMERIAGYTLFQDAILESMGEENGSDEQRMRYIDDVLMGMRQYNPYLESVSLLNREFEAVAVTDGYAVSDLSGLELAGVDVQRDGFWIGDLYERENAEGTIRLVAAAQSIDRGGERIGYLIEEIPISYFDRFRSETNLWQDGTLYLLDGKYGMITAGVPQEESRTSFQTTEADRENFQKAWDAVDHEATPSGCISYELGGDQYLTYFSDINYTDWGIRLTVNLSRYKSDVNTFRRLLLVTILIVTLVLLIASYILSRNLAQPVNVFAGVLERIQKEQNYSLRIRRKTKDEMGYLGSKIDELLDYIEQERYEVQQSERDPLTGLKNQKAVEREIQEVIGHAAVNGGYVALGYLDIDNFREINNRFGHLEADACVQFVAAILEDSVDGIVGRTGGDAFAFCIRNVESPEPLRRIASMILEKLNKGYFSHVANVQMTVPCSIGIAMDSGRHLSYSSLIHQASEALYQAKEKGKNTYHLIAQEEQTGSRFGTNERVAALMDALHQCVANDCEGFYLCHQPLIHASDGKVVGMESLLRWHHEPFGEVSPGIFVPLIEDDACFFKLGNWILKQSLTEAKPLLEQDRNFQVHVNVAYSQLVRREFRESVMEILKETDFPSANLCLELTERCRALDMNYLKEVMEFFRTQGITIALDDFGTGFSSLNLLRQLPVDRIKIDQSFIFNVRTNQADQAIVKSVIQCANSMDIEVCAEGVENDQIRDYLLQYKELIHQGYLYSRPVRIEEFKKLMPAAAKEEG